MKAFIKRTIRFIYWILIFSTLTAACSVGDGNGQKFTRFSPEEKFIFSMFLILWTIIIVVYLLFGSEKLGKYLHF
jgi:predicted small secreted protein